MDSATRKHGPGRGREVSLIERGEHYSRYWHKNSGKMATSQTSRADVFGDSINQTWEEKVPGGGGHRFEFVDREPLVFRVVFVLFLLNTFLGLLFEFGAKYFFPRASISLPPCEALAEGQYHAPQIICWFETQWIATQFVLLGLIVIILVIFRKRVRYVGRR
jgi:hypothetical protein